MSDQPDPTAGHSPLPWNDAWTTPSVWDDDGVAVVRPLAGASKEDAALIVREVNEAPKLRAEVERLRESLNNALRAVQGAYPPPTPRLGPEWVALGDVHAVCMSALLQNDGGRAALNPEDPSDG